MTQRLGTRSFSAEIPRISTPLLGQPVPFVPFLTHTSFDGDAFSDVATSTLIARTTWSRAIPAAARWLLLKAKARDSAAWGTINLYVLLGPTPDYYYALECRPAGGDVILVAGPSWVPCTAGDLYYQINASDTDTMDVWLEVWGWMP